MLMDACEDQKAQSKLTRDIYRPPAGVHARPKPQAAAMSLALMREIEREDRELTGV